MDKKITIPAGIALMVVLAVAGMLAIFSYTAATPVEASVKGGSVTYDAGPTVVGNTAAVEIGFETDAVITIDTPIIITFSDEFTVGAVDALGAVTVNDTAATATVLSKVVTVKGVAAGIDTDVSVKIPTGITAATAGAATVGVQTDTNDAVETAPVTLVDPVMVTGVTYSGPNVTGVIGGVTIGFNSDTNIAAGDRIVITFSSEFAVDDTTNALGNVTVNDDANLTITATSVGNVVTVMGAVATIPGAANTVPVSVSIPSGITAAVAVTGNVRVHINDGKAGSGEMGDIPLYAAELSVEPVKGPTVDFYGHFLIEFTTNLAIADGSIIVEFPEAIEFSGDEPLVAVDGVDVVPANVTLDGQTLTITGVAIAATEAAPADVTVSIESHETGAMRAPAMAAEYAFELTVGGFTASPSPTYTAAEHDYGVDFDTIPNKPNKNDEVIIEFNAPGGGITPGSFITIVMHEDFQVPEDISVADVTIDGNVRARDTNGARRRVADAAPAAVTVDDDSIYKPGDNDTADWLIQIEVGDMAAGDAFPGLQRIAPGARVTVTIAKAAGIKAPAEAKPDEDNDPTDDDGYQVSLSLEEEPDPTVPGHLIATTYLTTDRLITLSSQDGGRGDEIVATAKGWAGEKMDFWRDADADNIIDSSERVLCEQVELTDNVAECTFKLDSTFAAGHGDPTYPQCDGTAKPLGNQVANCNLINGLDSEGDVAFTDGEDDVVELKASVTLSPAEGNPGDSITVQIRDFPNFGPVDRIAISGGGNACDSDISTQQIPSCGESLNTRGDADVDIDIPNVDPGTRLLTVYVGDEDEDTNIVIGGGSIIATPTTVLPNQDVTLVVSGFGTGGLERITNITLGSNPILDWQISSPQLQATVNGPKFKLEDLGIDAGGSWSGSIFIPVTQDTADAGSDGSSRVLTITDSAGRTGSTSLTFAQRSVTISPDEGRRGSTISLSGENFPGLNKDGIDNLDVDVFYDGEEEESVEPDVNGRWQTTIEVPRDATIPSTNVIRVQFGDGKGGFTEIDTYRHRVPRASVTISPASGPEGSMVTLEGTGFGRFESLDELTVGGNDVTVSPNPSTDRNGDASFGFQIPGLDAGTQNVVVDFDGVTASVAFTVAEASGVVGAITSDVEVALEPLLTAGTLDRVFYFNNESKEWQWHIVDADFASSNNLDDVVSGAPLWVLVTEDTSATLNGRVVNFTCAGDDCWNLVTFP